jgi:hypothetical protein
MEAESSSAVVSSHMVRALNGASYPGHFISRETGSVLFGEEVGWAQKWSVCGEQKDLLIPAQNKIVAKPLT